MNNKFLYVTSLAIIAFLSISPITTQAEIIRYDYTMVQKNPTSLIQGDISSGDIATFHNMLGADMHFTWFFDSTSYKSTEHRPGETRYNDISINAEFSIGANKFRVNFTDPSRSFIHIIYGSSTDLIAVGNWTEQNSFTGIEGDLQGKTLFIEQGMLLVLRTSNTDLLTSDAIPKPIPESGWDEIHFDLRRNPIINDTTPGGGNAFFSGYVLDQTSFRSSVVPEPTTISLLLLGFLIGLCLIRRDETAVIHHSINAKQFC